MTIVMSFSGIAHTSECRAKGKKISTASSTRRTSDWLIQNSPSRKCHADWTPKARTYKNSTDNYGASGQARAQRAGDNADPMWSASEAGTETAVRPHATVVASAVRADRLQGWARTEIQAVGKNPDLLSPCHPNLAAFSAFGVPLAHGPRGLRGSARTFEVN